MITLAIGDIEYRHAIICPAIYSVRLMCCLLFVICDKNVCLFSYYGPSTSTPSKRQWKKHHLTVPSLSSIGHASSETLSNRSVINATLFSSGNTFGLNHIYTFYREDLPPTGETLEGDERTMDASEVLEER